MKKTITLFFILLLSMPAAFAFAAEKNFWIAPKIGTTGIGAEIGYRMNESFGLRVNGGYLTYEFGFAGARDASFGGRASSYRGDPDTTFSTEILNLTAIADWYFLSKNFQGKTALDLKLSGGIAYNDISSSEEVSGRFYLADREYTGSADTDISYDNKLAPYIGVGGAFRFGGDNADSMGIIFEFGGMYIGQSTATMKTNIPGADANQLTADRRQAENDIEDRARSFFPVANIGFAFYF